MDILKKTYKKHNGQFAKVRNWCIKHQDSWRFPQRVFRKINNVWTPVFFPEGLKELKANLVVSAREDVYENLDLFTLLKEQTFWSDDIISVYPFSITLTIENGATIVGKDVGYAHKFALNIAGFAGGTTVKIDNYGNIYGHGGIGGFGNEWTLWRNGASFAEDYAEAYHGWDGGTAINITKTNVTISNHSTGKICGGGGGGAAGLPYIKCYTNSIEQDGGPKKSLFGGPVPAPGTTNGVPIKKSWIIMDITDGGYGGGGAPNGRGFAQPNLNTASIEGLYRPATLEPHKIIALAMDPHVNNQVCVTDKQNKWFEANGLDEDSIGISKYYPEADTPQSPIFGPVGLVDNAETNLNNYKWKVKGTWYGKFWPSRPFHSRYVTKTIEVEGPKVFGSYARDYLGITTKRKAADGTASGPGLGGQVEWTSVAVDDGVLTNWDSPSLSDWGGIWQGYSCNKLVDPTTRWASHSTYHSVFGAYSDGSTGGELGEDGEGYTYPSQTINSPYGGELVVFPAITKRGGKAGKSILFDDSSNVTITDNGIIKGS